MKLTLLVTGDPRGVQLQVAPVGGAALDTTVSGTAGGVITVSDPSGLDLFAPSPLCSVVSATTVTCGAPADPVTYLTVTGGHQADRVNLAGLEAQNASASPLQKYPVAAEVDERMRGIFAVVTGNGGADEITGGGAGARYEPGDGNDTVHGGPGDELFRAGADPTDGADVFSGGGGYDTLSYAARTVAVSGVLGDTLTSGLGGGIPGGENDSVDGVEALIGGNGNDTLEITGQLGGFGTLSGGPGDDTLTGGPGPDKIVGGAGRDELFGAGGDDQLADPALRAELMGVKIDNLAGHLHGGEGDDELVQNAPADPFNQFADGVPTCGGGTDVLRADPGVDEGVGLYAGPADCELLSTVGSGGGTSHSSITAELRVGQTASIVPSPSLLGTPAAGRLGTTTWEICSADSAFCEQRVTDGPQITFGPGDAGRVVLFAQALLNEPLSQLPRWVEERAARRKAFGGPPALWAKPAGLAAILGVEAVQPPVAPPAKPEPASLLKALTASLGSKPKLKLLRKPKSLTLAAPAGTAVTVSITVKRGKKVTVLSRGAATADAKSKAKLVLKPTKAGKKAAKAGKKLTATVELKAAQAGGTAALASSKLKLRP